MNKTQPYLLMTSTGRDKLPLNVESKAQRWCSGPL